MNKFLIICIISLLVRECKSIGGKCNLTVSDVDHCSKKLMFFGDRENIIPSNDEEMSSYCSRMQEGIRCIRHYTKNCLPAFPKKVFGMFVFDAKTVMRRQCKLQKERSEFMRHVSCFLPKPYMEPIHLCIDKYIIQLEMIKQLPPNWRIPGVCCTFHLLQICIKEKTQTLCERKTGIETVDYTMNIVNSLTDNILDFTCGPYQSVAKCDQLMEPVSWNQMKETTNSEDLLIMRRNQKYFSPVPPLVEIITDFIM